MEHVNSSNVADFVNRIINIWPDLTRSYVGSTNCDGCVDSFLDLQRTFVVAGGRFREPYYWDSFWIIEGLLRTKGSFTEIARNIIENFLDFVEQFGFVPNGARVYYLNRSQPPLLTQMVAAYVEYTNDTSILERALPLLEKEYEFWSTNRSVTVETESGSYTLNHYAVSNNQPRPESYREDYVAANNRSYYATSGIIYPTAAELNETEQAELYANLASGAESGWDYSTRWLKNPSDAANDVYFPLRSLNVLETIPVDLNSILYANELSIAGFLNASGNATAASTWAERAQNRSKAIYELMWNATYHSFFDYNLTSSSQNVYTIADADAAISETDDLPEGQQVAFTIAQYYPFWTGATPRYLRQNPTAVRASFERIADQLKRKAGAIAATNLQSGQQWDEPNVWPPLMYIIIKGLLNTPPTFGEDDPDYQWTQELAFDLAQRYLDSTFCTWRATGGSTDDLPRLENVGEGNGTMFEKYANNATDAIGGGGEYEVVEGFGWTNGVLIWIADVFGRELKEPVCNITTSESSQGGTRRRSESAVWLDRRDAEWIRRFH